MVYFSQLYTFTQALFILGPNDEKSGVHPVCQVNAAFNLLLDGVAPIEYDRLTGHALCRVTAEE